MPRFEVAEPLLGEGQLVVDEVTDDRLARPGSCEIARWFPETIGENSSWSAPAAQPSASVSPPSKISSSDL